MSSRLRTTLLSVSAAVGIASVALLAAPAGAAPAGAPGNNGTVKIHDGSGEPSPEPRNEPHVCTFHVHGLFFDSGQLLTFTVQSWEPTGDRSVVLTGSIPADGSGEGRAPATGAYRLPDGHYRLTVDTGNGASTQDKHKMFWVRCATETSPPPTTAPPSGSPTTPPGSPGTPSGSPGSPSGSPGTPSGSPGRPSGSPGTPTGSPGSPTTPSGSPNAPVTPSSAPTTSGAAGAPVPPTSPPGAGLALTGSSTAAIAGLGLALALAGIALLLSPAARRRLLRG